MHEPTKKKIQIALPAMGEEEWLSIREVIESGWLTQGPKVAEFESSFASRHNVSHALATTSCTTALHLALLALGVGPGDEVIVPSFTWVATANAVLYCGATPVLCDVQQSTFNIDPSCVAEKVTGRTKAVIAVHLFGLCADICRLREILPGNVAIVEDAACAAGAVYHGAPAGSLGVAGCFSFHPRKSITTGEGGMVTTNDPNFAERAQILRNHGASVPEEVRHLSAKPYLVPEFNRLGFNYRMTDIQAAIGLVQLRKLDGFIDERNRYAQRYRSELANISWMRHPAAPDGVRHAWQAYVLYVDPEKAPLPRNDIMEALQQKGIATRPGTHAVHMLGYYRDRFGYDPAMFPVARDCENNSIAIPLHNRMSDTDVDYVVECVQRIAHVS